MPKDRWGIGSIRFFDVLSHKPLPKNFTDSDISIEDMKYSILDEAHVYHSASELLELAHINLTINPVHFVAFKPERILLHKVIVAISTSIQFETDRQFKELVRTFYKELLLEISGRFLGEVNNARHVMEVEVEKFLLAERVDEKFSTYIEVASSLASNEFGKGREEVRGERLFKQRVLDIAYARYIDDELSKVLTGFLHLKVRQQKVSLIPIPTPQKRMTFTTSGGTASGKTSSIALIMQLAEKRLGILWAHLAKLDTNMYQDLLIETGSVHPALFAQLSGPEASYLHTCVQHELERLAALKQAPHTFIDQVFVNSDKLQYGIAGGGRVVGYIVSTDVITAVDRSFQRGEKTGRYEPTKTILRTHKCVALELPQVLSQQLGAAITYHLVDNNVSYGQKPIPVADFDLLNKTITIHSVELFESFAKKTLINQAAKQQSEVYLQLEKGEDFVRQYLSSFSGDFTVSYDDETAPSP